MQGYNPDYSGLLGAGAMQADALSQLGHAGGNLIAQQRQKRAKDELMGQAREAISTGDPAVISELMITNPELAGSVQNAINFQSDATRQNLIGSIESVLTNPEMTEQVLTDRIKMVSDAGGDPSQSIAALQEYKSDPEGFLRNAEIAYSIYAPDKYKSYASAKSAGASTPDFQYKDGLVFNPATGDVRRTEFYQEKGTGVDETSAQQDFKYYQQLKKENPEAAQEFGRQKGYISRAGEELPVFMQKTLDKAQTDSFNSYNSSDSLVNLADNYAQNKGELGGGLFGSAQEAFKEFVGSEDEFSAIKKSYARLKNAQVIKSLPQGPATDRDIAIFSKGFPGENADPEYIESFLRGMAKAEYINGRFNEFKAQYISENGDTRGMVNAWKDASKGIKGEIDQRFETKAESIDDLVKKYGG